MLQSNQNYINKYVKVVKNSWFFVQSFLFKVFSSKFQVFFFFSFPGLSRFPGKVATLMLFFEKNIGIPPSELTLEIKIVFEK